MMSSQNLWHHNNHDDITEFCDDILLHLFYFNDLIGEFFALQVKFLCIRIKILFLHVKNNLKHEPYCNFNLWSIKFQ